jgi:hypothetical protein
MNMSDEKHENKKHERGTQTEDLINKRTQIKLMQESRLKVRNRGNR